MRQIAAPTHTYLTRMIVAAAGLGLVGVSAMRAAPVAQEPVAPITFRETPSVVMSPIVMAQEPPPVALSKQVALVFTAGGATYMKLASLDGAIPKHGKAKRSTDDYVENAVASVEAANMPATHRGWLGKTVSVDGACTAKVVGFAVVARLVGDPAYAGFEGEAWQTSGVWESGAKVLAAKLDNCAGGVIARDASLAPVVVPQTIDNPVLVAAATAQLVRSAEAKAGQEEWATAEQKGRWYDSEGVESTAQVLRHPKTGAIWVSVHLYYGGGCGSPNISVWGLFRAGEDGSLTRTKAEIGELTKIEKLVDIDGDGDFEVIGRPWLGTERAIQSKDAKTLQELAVPFFYCPC